MLSIMLLENQSSKHRSFEKMISLFINVNVFFFVFFQSLPSFLFALKRARLSQNNLENNIYMLLTSVQTISYSETITENSPMYLKSRMSSIC